ncbi:GGDEF domain-containing protein [Sphingosinicella sp. CPCC 101087]|uniref:GGDEF domain-containing protein n=1 Tax=Sphingosinicella sp. CPCC 101087 TaxID=2497754 RepID=UPI0013ECCCC8|nr:GGDEF domain-containing protein [Sphingosinicella sp. CPCC 101087]
MARVAANDSFPLPAGHLGQLSGLLLGLPAPICLIDRSFRYAFVNEAMAEVHGLSAGTIKGRRVAEFFPPAPAALDRWFEAADAGRPLPERQVSWQGRHYRLVASPLRDLADATCGISIVAFDITRRVRFEAGLRESRRRLLSLARHDELTGLLNRRGLESQLNVELGRARREQRPVSLLMIDIDCFKSYNDLFGHLEGDACLRAVSAVLGQEMRRPGDVAGRFGGEEFVALLSGMTGEGARQVAERLRTAVEALNLAHPGSEPGKVTISIGVASVDVASDCGPARRHRDRLIQAADHALYRAKAAGRNSIGMASVSGTARIS